VGRFDCAGASRALGAQSQSALESAVFGFAEEQLGVAAGAEEGDLDVIHATFSDAHVGDAHARVLRFDDAICNALPAVMSFDCSVGIEADGGEGGQLGHGSGPSCAPLGVLPS
jgi:hypothetical protein